MIGGDETFRIPQDQIGILNNRFRRKPTIHFAEAHRSSCEHCTHTDAACFLSLNVYGLAQSIIEEIMVIARAGATGEQELGQRQTQ